MRSSESVQQKTTQSSDVELKELLIAFFEVHGITVTPGGLAMWIDGLAGLTTQGIAEALRRFNRESSEYPKPATVRKYAGLEGLTDEKRAEIAWGTVRRTILSYGAYYAVNFNDPLVNAAIRNIGGWESLCNTPTDELVWKEKSFVQAYVTVARTGIGDGRPLSGLVNSDAGPVEVETGLPRSTTTLRVGYSGTHLLKLKSPE